MPKMMTWKISGFMCFFKGDISKSRLHWQLLPGFSMYGIGLTC